jgi:DnaJ-domain-containing protein 1
MAQPVSLDAPEALEMGVFEGVERMSSRAPSKPEVSSTNASSLGAGAIERAQFDKNGFITSERGKQIIAEDGLSLMDGGRGVLSGYVKCSLCNVKSKRKYAFGRGFTKHLAAIHPNDDHVQAVLDSKATLTPPGYDKQGNKAVSYKDSLPPACLAARSGHLEELMSLEKESVVRERDKFGANALDWASGGGHLDCCRYLVPIMPLEEYSKQPVKRRDGKSCLHWSCRNGFIETTEYLLNELFKTPMALVDLKTGDGTTPVQLAFFGGHVHMLSWLHEQFGASSKTPIPDLFSHSNTWGCFSEHFSCMSPACKVELFHFYVDVVYEGSMVDAARQFFGALNTEGMTPVHKWLLHIGKEGRDISESLNFLLQMKEALLEAHPDFDIPNPPETIVKFILERITNQKNIRDAVTDEEREGIKALMPQLEKEAKKDYYKVLGLSEEASAEDIRKAYRALALRYHPDKNQGAGMESWQKEALTNTFKSINEAYAVISDKVGILA